MKFITSISELEGKTIQRATSVDSDESVALIFTDDTCAFFDVCFYGESHDLNLVDNTSDHLKRDAGIITEEEFLVIQQKEQVRIAEAIKKRELETLEKLKAKYEA